MVKKNTSETSKSVASKAAKVLRDPSQSPDAKAVAASALKQTKAKPSATKAKPKAVKAAEPTAVVVESPELLVGRFYAVRTESGANLYGEMGADGFTVWLGGKPSDQKADGSFDACTVREISREACYEYSSLQSQG